MKGLGISKKLKLIHWSIFDAYQRVRQLGAVGRDACFHALPPRRAIGKLLNPCQSQCLLQVSSWNYHINEKLREKYGTGRCDLHV